MEEVVDQTEHGDGSWEASDLMSLMVNLYPPVKSHLKSLKKHTRCFEWKLHRSLLGLFQLMFAQFTCL